MRMSGQGAQVRRVAIGGDLGSSSAAARAAPTSPAASTISTYAASSPRPRQRVLGLFEHAADRRVGRIDLTLGQAQQRQTWLGSRPTGWPADTRLLPSRTRRAAGGSRPAGRGPRRAPAGPCRHRSNARCTSSHGVRPRAVQLHDLGPMHQTLAA